MRFSPHEIDNNNLHLRTDDRGAMLWWLNFSSMVFNARRWQGKAARGKGKAGSSGAGVMQSMVKQIDGNARSGIVALSSGHRTATQSIGMAWGGETRQRQSWEQRRNAKARRFEAEWGLAGQRQCKAAPGRSKAMRGWQGAAVAKPRGAWQSNGRAELLSAQPSKAKANKKRRSKQIKT